MSRWPALSICLLPMLPLAWAEAPPPARQAELHHLIRHDCGSCHGLTLKGGLGPPLLPAALAARDPQWLEDIIWFGSAANAMPPWQGILSRQEIHWMVQQLLLGEMP